jgi:hypothetical protein
MTYATAIVAAMCTQWLCISAPSARRSPFTGSGTRPSALACTPSRFCAPRYATSTRDWMLARVVSSG